MAKPNWITLGSTSGSGSGSFNVTCASTKARTAATGSITVTTAGGKTATISVTRSAATVYFTDPVVSSNTINASGGTVTITFTTNAKYISLATIDYESASLSVDGTTDSTWTGGKGYTAVTGDPGLESEYQAIITLTFAANTSVDALSWEDVRLKCIGTTASDYVDGSIGDFTQSGADSSLSVSPTSLTFTANGGTSAVTVTSNDSWTIS